MLWNIIFFAVFAYAAYHLASKFGEKSVTTNVMIGVAVGAVAAVLKGYLIPKVPGLSWLYLIIILGFVVGICYQFSKEGNERDEFVAGAVLIGLSGLLGAAAAANYSSVVPLLLALTIPVIAIGFCAVSALIDNRNDADDTDKPKFTRWMAATVALALLLVIGGSKLAFSLADNGYLGNQQSPTVTEQVQAGTDTKTKAKATDTKAKNEVKTAASNWHFYNNDVQGGNAEDDFNFGPAPKVDTAAEYDKDFRKRLEEDPALGAADMAWADAWLGTRYLGEFYESCNEDWAKTINAAKEAWIKDPAAYKQTLDAFFQMLNTAEVKVTAGNGLEDQMYMNPYTVDGTPDVIVLATPDHTGKFLTYLFTIKGTGKVKVMYRIECGYQPTNVEEVMGIKPQTKPSNPGGSNNPGKGDNPTPSPSPTPTPKKQNVKDQTQIPKKNTEPNDDKGPGPNTNNPSDPNHSTKDTKDSSTSMSYDDYKKNVDNLKDTNKNQKTGSDSNTPSTPAPAPNTNVDNNGDTGNGGAPINTPTPKQEAQTTSGDPAAGHMAEPS